LGCLYVEKNCRADEKRIKKNIYVKGFFLCELEMLLPVLSDIVEDGNIMRLFVGTQCTSLLRTINFAITPPKADFMHNQYRVLLEDGFPGKREDLVCIFPNHPVKSKRFLQLCHYNNRDKFNKELNKRFSESPECTEQFKEHRFLVLYGSHCYICKGITGSIYVVWATQITRINKSNAASIPYTNVPMIMNCDRQASIKSLYILRPQIENKPLDLSLMPKTVGNPKFMYDKRFSPFVCETRPDEQDPRSIVVISKEDALAMVMQSTKDIQEWLPFERVPFSLVETAEEGIVEMNMHSSWAESPREIFSTHSDLLINENISPPQLFKGGVDEPDPFESTRDDENTGENTGPHVGVEIDLADL